MANYRGYCRQENFAIASGNTYSVQYYLLGKAYFMCGYQTTSISNFNKVKA